MLFIYGLFLKIIYKLKLGHVFYPLFKRLNHIFTVNSLPTIEESKHIIYHNTVNKRIKNKIFQYNHNSFTSRTYDLQIIIPVYNSEKYIRQCLNSIINQKTNYTFQIILVNDGSTDNTSKILKEYSSNSLIRIINEKNYGRSAARDKGLNYINSKYIMFVDSDDKLAPNAIQNLLLKAYETRADVVFGGSYTIDKENKIKVKFDYKNNNQLCLNSNKDIDDFVWGKIFKSNLFKNVYFPIGYEFEDMMPEFLIYPRCHKLVSINDNVYYYRYNSSGITHSFQFSNVSIDSFLMLSLMVKSLNRYNIQVNLYIYNTFLSQVKTTCMRNIYVNTNIQKSIFVLLCQLYDKYFSKLSTNINLNVPLEKSLKNKDYMEYIVYCIMK